MIQAMTSDTEQLSREQPPASLATTLWVWQVFHGIARYMPIKTSGSHWIYATYSDMAKGILYAADHGVRVINVNFGGRTASSTLSKCRQLCVAKKRSRHRRQPETIAATISYPAACEYAVAVSATTLSDDTFASFSNYGNQIALSAPGRESAQP
jgi:hypothetical protein